mmetsp:Transcript_9672/g.30120  ORF Transcript_9672/g.30120 Transcript_9672/m.30120 type:complete len:395 (+) Transcript_9672:249-1433(+)
MPGALRARDGVWRAEQPFDPRDRRRRRPGVWREAGGRQRAGGTAPRAERRRERAVAVGAAAVVVANRRRERVVRIAAVGSLVGERLAPRGHRRRRRRARRRRRERPRGRRGRRRDARRRPVAAAALRQRVAHEARDVRELGPDALPVLELFDGVRELALVRRQVRALVAEATDLGLVRPRRRVLRAGRRARRTRRGARRRRLGVDVLALVRREIRAAVAEAAELRAVAVVVPGWRQAAAAVFGVVGARARRRAAAAALLAPPPRERRDRLVRRGRGGAGEREARPRVDARLLGERERERAGLVRLARLEQEDGALEEVARQRADERVVLVLRAARAHHSLAAVAPRVAGHGRRRSRVHGLTSPPSRPRARARQPRRSSASGVTGQQAGLKRSPV